MSGPSPLIELERAVDRLGQLRAQLAAGDDPMPPELFGEFAAQIAVVNSLLDRARHYVDARGSAVDVATLALILKRNRRTDDSGSTVH